MFDVLILTILIGLTSSYILCALQLSSFLLSYWKVFRLLLLKLSKGRVQLLELTGWEELLMAVHLKSEFLADLLSCPYCLAAWVAFLPSLVATIYMHLPILSTPLIWFPAAFIGSVGRLLAEKLGFNSER